MPRLGDSGYLRCGKRPFRAVHARGSNRYEHDYESAGNARAGTRLCKSCEAGQHRGYKSEIGCLETVEPPPRDLVCQCQLCREHPRSRALWSGRSDAEGVIRCRM